MSGLRATIIALLAGLATSGCVSASPGAVSPPQVAVLANSAQASQYGTEATQIFDHPALRAKVRELFGVDWSGKNPIGLSAPAPAFFAKSSRPTMLRIDNADWIAVKGCMPAACALRHGLVLIGPGGDRLFARVDDGGFTGVYGFGRGMVNLGAQDRALVDAAWRALALEGRRTSLEAEHVARRLPRRGALRMSRSQAVPAPAAVGRESDSIN